ncbi:hypothetical protein CO174_02755 [Candidatus Uhrbacteria bacterium CG_4_9_14_3_um_filter_50_9]|uniref:CheR-type methyltransferase domain-containing protein n=1 Tax=Candidatus Uhrbacteria bacterium CG_4_9_14_3_um_filter_50_9 TaxID=1975035 RepID=A0A2M7XCB4_9BACT|nr:MAG: hypothetical protein CO174_02755 [Candidatus Uhrbacteria bacterium CG_4_9_14_3_um_filter_50_9]
MEFNTLDDVRAFVQKVGETLDPRSRYISELLSVVNQSEDVADLEARLCENSRGLRHSGPDVFQAMSLADKLRANLITNETDVFRFESADAAAIVKVMQRIQRTHLVSQDGRPVRVLVAPCSHGAEAFTVSSLALRAGVRVQINAWDVQRACIESARTGMLVTGMPFDHLAQPAIVSEEVLAPISFEVVDLFEWIESDDDRLWDIVLCRNFLGYFQREVVIRLLRRLEQVLSGGGLLVLDPFAVDHFFLGPPKGMYVAEGTSSLWQRR